MCRGSIAVFEIFFPLSENLHNALQANRNIKEGKPNIQTKSSYQAKFSCTSSFSGRCEVLYLGICEMLVLLHFICQVTTNHATFSMSVCLPGSHPSVRLGRAYLTSYLN